MPGHILFIQCTKERHIEYIELVQNIQQLTACSPLLHLPGFDVTTCLPFDIMHNIYEGIVPCHLNLLF